MSSLLLALETATTYASVALLEGEELVAEVGASGKRPHSARVLPAVDALLQLVGVRAADLAGFAVSVGPGSFTGLRVGVATVKGLAFGDSVPVAPVPTLEALASSTAGQGPVLACLDARRGEVYAAAFVDGAPAVLPEGVYGPAALAERLPDGCRVVGAAGEETLLEALAGRLPHAELAAPQPLRAWWTGRLGVRLLAAGKGVAASALAPRYVRRAEAEVHRTGRRFESSPA